MRSPCACTRRHSLVAAFGVLLAMASLHAQVPGGPAPAPAEDVGSIVDLEALVVSGAQPGPGLWTVRNGPNVLRVLGTVTPLPRRMEWMSGEVEAAIAASQVVIAPPSVRVDADVGFFRGMALVPAMLRARNNPGGRPLAEVVGPGLHARWAVLKARYMGRDRGVEKRRPLLAAHELYEAALRRSGLVDGGLVEGVVRRARREAGVPQWTRWSGWWWTIPGPRCANCAKASWTTATASRVRWIASRATWTRCARAPTPGRSATSTRCARSRIATTGSPARRR